MGQRLGMKVTVTVGIGYDRELSRIDDYDAKVMTEEALTDLTFEFGGVTVSRGTGSWQNPKSKLIVQERVNIFTVFTVDQDPDVPEKVAKFLNNKFNQENVLVEVVYFENIGINQAFIYPQ